AKKLFTPLAFRIKMRRVAEKRRPCCNPGQAVAVRTTMKVLVIGAEGTIGSAIVEEFKERHDVATAGRSHGDYHVDIADLQSIRNLFSQIGMVDAVVSAAGSVHFGPLLEMTPEQ